MDPGRRVIAPGQPGEQPEKLIAFCRRQVRTQVALDLSRHLHRPAEQRRLAGLAAADPARCWDRLLFCAKESVYKAWFPLARRWLGFGDADITIDPDSATFTATLLVPGPAVGGSTVGAFRGNFAVGNGLIVTAVSVPAPEPRPWPE